MLKIHCILLVHQKGAGICVKMLMINGSCMKSFTGKYKEKKDFYWTKFAANHSNYITTIIMNINFIFVGCYETPFNFFKFNLDPSYYCERRPMSNSILIHVLFNWNTSENQNSEFHSNFINLEILIVMWI